MAGSVFKHGHNLHVAGLHTLVARDTSHGLGAGALGRDLDATQIRIEFFAESVRACTDALQACHRLYPFFTVSFFIKDPVFHIIQNNYAGFL